MNKYTLADIGKNLLVEPAGTELSAEEVQLLERLQPRSIMFRKRNFLEGADYGTWLAQYAKLVGQIRQAVKHERLIFSIDHEGGRVIRPPEPITRFPYAARYRACAAEVGTAMATELQSLGVNVNFAPVADIHSNPDNPVINERAFGRTAAEAASAAVAFAGALAAGAVAPCAKHFPGHGDTKTDSHFAVPVVDLPLSELEKRELAPFQALINAGVPMVMTAHIVFPQIDPVDKATVSRVFLTEILRDKMGFAGVVIADALGMAAIKDAIGQRQTVVKAINAGLDIFLVAGDSVAMSDGVKMAELVLEALELGEISHGQLAASHARIDAFLQTLPQHRVTRLSDTTLAKHHKMAEELSKSDSWSDSGFMLSLPGFE